MRPRIFLVHGLAAVFCGCATRPGAAHVAAPPAPLAPSITAAADPPPASTPPLPRQDQTAIAQKLAEVAGKLGGTLVASSATSPTPSPFAFNGTGFLRIAAGVDGLSQGATKIVCTILVQRRVARDINHVLEITAPALVEFQDESFPAWGAGLPESWTGAKCSVSLPREFEGMPYVVSLEPY